MDINSIFGLDAFDSLIGPRPPARPPTAARQQRDRAACETLLTACRNALSVCGDPPYRSLQGSVLDGFARLLKAADAPCGTLRDDLVMLNDDIIAATRPLRKWALTPNGNLHRRWAPGLTATVYRARRGWRMVMNIEQRVRRGEQLQRTPGPLVVEAERLAAAHYLRRTGKRLIG